MTEVFPSPATHGQPPVTGTSRGRPRLVWVDTAKAFAILCVVFGHVLRGLHDAGVIADARIFEAIDTSIYLFHMPLFFLLSGLTFSGQGLAWPHFLMRLGRAIILPYVIWSAALVGIKYLGQGSVNHPVGFADLLGIAYAPISPFWFFYALFLIQVAARITLPLAGSAGLLALAALAWLGHFTNPEPGSALDSALEFLPYFAIGAALRPHLFRPPSPGLVGALVASLVFLALPLICVFGGIGYASLPGRIAGIPMILAACLVFIWIGGTRLGRARVVQVTGQATLAIYCLHIFFTGTTRAVLLKLGVDDPGLHLVLGTLLGTVPPIVLQLGVTRFGLAAWLGFPRLHWPRPDRAQG